MTDKTNKTDKVRRDLKLGQAAISNIEEIKALTGVSTDTPIIETAVYLMLLFLKSGAISPSLPGLPGQDGQQDESGNNEIEQTV